MPTIRNLPSDHGVVHPAGAMAPCPAQQLPACRAEAPARVGIRDRVSSTRSDGCVCQTRTVDERARRDLDSDRSCLCRNTCERVRAGTACHSSADQTADRRPDSRSPTRQPIADQTADRRPDSRSPTCRLPASMRCSTRCATAAPHVLDARLGRSYAAMATATENNGKTRTSGCALDDGQRVEFPGPGPRPRSGLRRRSRRDHARSTAVTTRGQGDGRPRSDPTSLPDPRRRRFRIGSARAGSRRAGRPTQWSRPTGDGRRRSSNERSV